MKLRIENSAVEFLEIGIEPQGEVQILEKKQSKELRLISDNADDLVLISLDYNDTSGNLVLTVCDEKSKLSELEFINR